ncbi:unnamed protein product [Rhizophagus irregularis]|nr:unnamed protein product [Rhizophagus irregularis]
MTLSHVIYALMLLIFQQYLTYRPPGALDNTSNDTKRLELRPHKRKSSQQVTNFFSNRIDDNLKRRRTYPALTDDLSDAGLSSSKSNN